MAMFGKSGPGWGDTLSTIGAVLTDVGSGEGPRYTMALANQRKEAMKQARAMEAQQQLMGLFGGQAAASGVGGVPNIADPRVAQAILMAKNAGADVDTALEIMKAGQVDVAIGPDGRPYNKRSPESMQMQFRNPQAVGNAIIDLNNPENEGYVVPDAPVKGAMPIYDNRGRVVDWQIPQGALGAISAVAGAEAGGKAPYEFVQVPTASGAPRTISKSAARGGDFVGQTPADAVRAESLARGDADRANAIQQKANAAASQLSTLDNMERLLPDVISGFGADARLNAARALALAGNDDAKRKVAATETYLNEARNLVSDIIKSFGANPTEGERKYAERMSGADANLNPETLKEGIRLRRERINRDLQSAGRAPQGKPQITREQALEELRRRGLAK